MEKPAVTRYPIHELLKRRWSPRAFSDRRVEPDKLPATLPVFRNLLAGYAFQTGQNYAEYRSGDKVAKYGLAALVLGGTAVGAAKLGLFAWLAVFLKKGWKLVVVAFAAVAAAFKKIVGKLFGGRTYTGHE